MPVLMQRIAARPTYERNMEQDYIEVLNRSYEEFFSQPRGDSPVLPIDTNGLNIVQNPEDLKSVENRIREQLQLSPFQPSLPFNS
jgi:deoxyadenosine/deoxycytidine kinase